METRKVGYEDCDRTQDFTIVQFNNIGDISHHYLYNLRKDTDLDMVYGLRYPYLTCYFKVKLDGGYNKTKN